jgi:polyhydroxyalkanoate synthesis repressor PhaR
MLVIKRYPNRKLYDTEAKQYITLDGIADLIRSGIEVQVIDNASGEDLTAVTLSQIIFEQEKRQGGFLSMSILTNLIQAGGDRLSSLQRSLPSPKNIIQLVDEEISQRVNALVAQGELLEAEAQVWLEKLVSSTGHPVNINPANEDQIIEKVIRKYNLPNKGEVDELASQLEIISEKLDGLGKSKE